jgi:hypothetical protein
VTTVSPVSTHSRTTMPNSASMPLSTATFSIPAP